MSFLILWEYIFDHLFEIFNFRMASVSKDKTWKYWNTDSEYFQVLTSLSAIGKHCHRISCFKTASHVIDSNLYNVKILNRVYCILISVLLTGIFKWHYNTKGKIHTCSMYVCWYSIVIIPPANKVHLVHLSVCVCSRV